MKYYSEVTKMFYDTPEECKEQEEKVLAERKAKEEKEKALKAEREARAKEVEEAFDKAFDLLDKFSEDYRGYNLTINRKGNSTNFINRFLNYWF